MKTMKRMIAFAVLMLLVVLSVDGFAQSKMTDQQKQEMKARYEAYKAKLNLTGEQAPQVEKINSDYFGALSELRESSESRMSKFKKFRDLKSKKDKKMKNILTPGQYKVYTDYQEEMKDEFMKNRKK